MTGSNERSTKPRAERVLRWIKALGGLSGLAAILAVVIAILGIPKPAPREQPPIATTVKTEKESLPSGPTGSARSRPSVGEHGQASRTDQEQAGDRGIRTKEETNVARTAQGVQRKEVDVSRSAPDPQIAKEPQAQVQTSSAPRAYPVGKEFWAWWYRARLNNIEIADGKVLQFNFDVAFLPDCAPCPSHMEVYLEGPQHTTFLIDQLGRQHRLVEAVGISSAQVLLVPLRSTRRFTLIFPLRSDIETFDYETVLLGKVAIQGEPRLREIPLQIRGKASIRVADFR